MQLSTRNILARAAMTLFLVLFGTSGLWAEDVTAEQAREEAMSFLTHRSSSPNGLRRAPGVKPQLTLQGKVSGLYVFNVNANDGYVIVSNDDRTLPVLGFSDTGSFDPDRMPENMKAWLQGYADEIAWLQQHGSTASGPKKARSKVGSHSTDYIHPMLSTTWNQGAPYNDLCPTFENDPIYGSGTCASGCVATAMAQVMMYHQWPYETTQPIPGYHSQTQVLDIDLPELPVTTFDWTKMSVNYSAGYTAEEADAIATLMQYCGRSVRMDYGVSSGADSDDVADALKNYFGYNSSATQVKRLAYTFDNWTDLIYHELANARPVLYGGLSNGGGHAFVCDGYMYYDDTDYFHINWGWGGMSDDFFVLSALDPQQQGIGAGNGGYRYNQDAVIGIQKPTDDGTIANVPTRQIRLYTNSITVCNPIAVVGQPVRVIVNITNYGEDEFDGNLIDLANKKGEFSYELLGSFPACIPARETKDCVAEFIPSTAGTYNLMTIEPDTHLQYSTTFEVKATVEVLDASVAKTSDVVPVYGSWCDRYSKSQFVIAESDMQGMQDKFINGMTFYAYEGEVSWGAAEFDIYMSEVSDATIDALMDWDTLEKVYSGSLSIKGNRMEMTFDNAFHYQGGNLLIGIKQTVTDGTYVSCSWSGITANGASVGGYNDGSSDYIYQRDFLPIVSFDLITASLQKPTDLAVNVTSFTSAEVSWKGNADSYNLRYATYTPGTVLFSDDFESGLGQWTVIQNGEGDNWSIWHQDSGRMWQNVTNHSGDWVAMSFSQDGGNVYDADNWLISPLLELGGQMTYWVRDHNADHDHYDIYVCTTGYDASNFDETDFTKIYEPGDASDEWTEHTVDLSDYAGQWGYIAFRHKDMNKYVVMIDDVTVTSAIEPDTWTEVSDVTSPYTLTGLAQNTPYIVEVQSVIGSATSDWASVTFDMTSANPVPYNIAADIAADGATLTWEGIGDSYNVRYRTAGDTEAVFFDDFENGLDQWTIYTEGESSRPNGWNSQSSSNIATAYSGDHCAGAWSTNCNADNWLVTPQLTLGKELRFWVNVNRYARDGYEVRLSTTGNDIQDFDVVLQPMGPGPDNGEWNEVVIDLSAYAGLTGYIAIHHEEIDQNYLFIDDFAIYDYNIPTGPWIEMAVYDTNVTLSYLPTNNAYDYQIQSIKDGTASEWSPVESFALLTLANNNDNTYLIDRFDGKKAHVTLAGRTFYKDNCWNTIFLPFELDAAEMAASPLADGNLQSLIGMTVDGSMVTLKFSGNLIYWSSHAGYPHIIKWADGDDIVNPEFANVTITSQTENTHCYNSASGITITFNGTYAPITFPNEDKSILFIGQNNKLYWPLPGASIGAMRCYFEITGLTAGIKECIMDFGENDPDGISEISDNNESHDWYDLSGRKLAGKPTMKGIYVNSGRKVTIK